MYCTWVYAAYVVHCCNCLQICCLWTGDHNCDWEWRDSTISESQSILALAMHCRAVFVRDVQCRHVTSLVAISVRVAVAIPSQPWRSRWVIHTFSSTPCQSIPDSQSYSGIPLSTTDHQPSYRGWPGIVRVTLTVRDTLTIGTWVCIFCDSPIIGMNCQSYNGLFRQTVIWHAYTGHVWYSSLLTETPAILSC